MLLYGCSDDSYKGVQDDLISSDEQVPVMIAVGDPSGGVVKGDGPVDNVKDLMNDDIYVYAFNKSASTSFRTPRSQSSLDCLVDASTDASRSVSGRRARLKTSDVYMTWVDESRTIYWPAGQETITAFDFYAYYLGGLQVPESAYSRQDDKVAIDITIDGSADLMTSRARPTESQMASLSKKDQLAAQVYSYSHYMALRNIVPTFMFSHNLVRLDFEIVPGVTHGIRKRVYIQDISIESQTRGTFVVAAKDESEIGATFSGDAKKLYLPDKDGTTIPKDHYRIDTRSDASETIVPLSVGSCLFVAPSSSYLFRTTLKEMDQSSTDSVLNEQECDPIEISAGEEGFLPGNSYKVKITVSGWMNVSVVVSLDRWESGGSTTIDREEVPEG